MKHLPEKIENEGQLEELLSRPGSALAKMFSELEGDIIFLGVNGKIGISLSRMAARACREAGVKKKLAGVDRFFSKEVKAGFNENGIETFQGDLLNTEFLHSLPQYRNVIFLAGMKFGSVDNLPQTWAINTYLPALVAGHFRNSRIAVFSTGCVYPLVSLSSGGSVESDPPMAIGEYAQSCLGRERMFEYGSDVYGTPVTLIRLNYSVEMRYGVLVDIALKVMKGEPVDLSMGYFNVIWQGDVNNIVLRSLNLARSPAKILNVTGPEILSVRDVAAQFGRLFGKEPVFSGNESESALLNNASQALNLFGNPEVPVDQVIKWTASWLAGGGRLLNKPTHFEVRDGIY